MGPIEGPAPRRTCWQAVDRSIAWNWTCVIALQITDPSSRQRGRPTSTNPQLSKNNQREKGKNWSRVPDGCLTPRKTGRLIVGRNITLTLTWLWQVSVVKSGHESCGTRARESLHWLDPAAVVNYAPVLSSYWAPHVNKLATVWQ
jgi:hypothetical protein